MNYSLYNISISIIYKLLIPFLWLFSKKINDWKKAQKQSKSILENIQKKEGSIWFHCASLGEYEQIKPIISYCQNNVNKHIYITFFSNSGFNNLNINNNKITVLMYPPDIKNVITNFIEKINPEKIDISIDF